MTISSLWPRVNVLGVGVNPISMAEAVQAIGDWIINKNRHYVCLAPAHNILACQSDPSLKVDFNRAGFVAADGMPMVWIARRSGYPKAERVYGPDLIEAVCKHSAGMGFRHYFYGAEPGVAGNLADLLQHRYPGLQVAGAHAPPFRPLSCDEWQAEAARINSAEPDIVWVALGSPGQERWMAGMRSSLHAAALVGVGAAFDFLTGSKPQAPRWMQRSGLEWLFRLATEPRRLWRRYLGYPLFVVWYVMQLLGIRNYPAPSDMPSGAADVDGSQPDSRPTASANILGVNIEAWEPEGLHKFILAAVRGGGRARVLNVNAHALNLAYQSRWLRDCFNEAEIVFPDGQGVVLAARLLGAPFRSRVTYADWFWQLASFCSEFDISMFFLGGRPRVADRARDMLCQSLPRLRVVGARHGYFSKDPESPENDEVLAAIQEAQPDVLVVGFGMPLQEHWLMENWDRLSVKVGLTGGAVFDYVSGTLARPPRIMTENGLEWLGRLFIEPQRLWRRYLIGNPIFMLRVIRQRLRGTPS